MKSDGLLVKYKVQPPEGRKIPDLDATPIQHTGSYIATVYD